jgi:hypothetical protein
MRRAALALSLTFVCGCGSCVEEKSAPVVEPASPAPVRTILSVGEAGSRRPVVVGDGVGFAGIGQRDASR